MITCKLSGGLSGDDEIGIFKPGTELKLLKDVA
jgi:hypothetical protein